jgi:uncharacterized membrane protein
LGVNKKTINPLFNHYLFLKSSIWESHSKIVVHATKEIGATNQTKRLTRSGNLQTESLLVTTQNMKTKTTQTVINNLKEKIAERKLQLTDLYTQYYYKAAIKQTVDEKIGVEPNRDLLRYVEGK